MSNLRLVPENYIDDATLTATPSMIATLPITNVQLPARDDVARSSSIVDQVIEGHWNTNSRKVDSFFIFRHTGFGSKIRVQLFGGSDWTSQVYDSGTVDFVGPLIRLDLFEWGSAPLGLSSTDLLAPEAPYSLFFTAVTCASFRITLTSCQAPYWELGRIFLGKYIEAPYNPEVGMQFGWVANTERTRSRGASLRTRGGERWRELSASMYLTPDIERAAWRDLLARVTSADCAISIFPGFGGRQERDHVFNGALVQHAPFAWMAETLNTTTIKFTEL